MSSGLASPEALTFGQAGRTWQALADHVESFVSAWESGAEPPLASFLPSEPSPLRRLTLVELIKVDLEYRWRPAGKPRSIESYLAEFPELAQGGFPCDLVYEEFHVRKQAGEAIEPDEYLKRFPQQAAELGRLLALEAPQQTTTLVRKSKVPQLEAGERLDDFDLLCVLGRGAFASVFLARQRSMQRLVALKISADHGDEPQTLAQLDHPQIVRVYDQRLLPDRGLRLLYMQYLPGGTLYDVVAFVRQVPARERTGRTLLEAVDRTLRTRGEEPPGESALRKRLASLTWPEAVCWLGAKLALALDYAHRLGVLHRDVKPANVLLTAEAAPKLADFNVSFSSKLDGANPSAFFGGSLAYMSPEQMEAFSPRHERAPDSLDGRSDVYGLGVLLCELLTGQRPFRDEAVSGSWSEAVERLLAERRAGLNTADVKLPADSPAGLEEVLRTCLAPEADQRFASAGALGGELNLCLQPRAQRLLRTPGHDWRRLLRRFPTMAVLLAAVLPNILAAFFNFLYNRREIVEQLQGSEPVFEIVQLLINAVAFPLGIAILAWLTWPLSRGLREQSAPPVPTLPFLRQRCLRLGHIAAVICFTLWAVAGIAYPASMQVAVGPLSAATYVHFFASLVLCGLMAAAYPFFAVTFLAVRVLYPAFVRPGTTSEQDVPPLIALSRTMGVYLWLAASVPMLAVVALVLTGSSNRLALGVLSISGLAGFAVSFWLARLINEDLTALASTLRPPSELAESTHISLS
jgi:serine/threonine protein kinase